MTFRPSPAVWSISYCAGYCLTYRSNMPLFRYYPVPHEWAWGATDEIVRPGPPMVWYGLVVSAALIATAMTLIAAATAFVFGGKRPMPSLRGGLWVAPWLAAAYCIFLLRLFFR